LKLFQLPESLHWRWRAAQRDLFLLTRFRNGLTLRASLHQHAIADRAVCWDGLTLYHPNRLGLAQTLLEIWCHQVYTGRFYRPSDGDVIVDAGANVGLFCVWLARKYPRCRIVAFEPFPENYAILRRNIDTARITSIEAHQAALGGRSGFGVIHDGGNRSLDHQLQPISNVDDQASRTTVHSFADVLQMAGAARIALFKIDIEGSEGTLIESADESDLKRISRFAIEYHDNIRPGTSRSLQTRLEQTHVVRMDPDPGGYGMLYATSKALL
jgi:FkbM family methyltransferase